MRDFFYKFKIKKENSKNYKKKLINKYKLKITPGIKTQNEIINSIKKQFDLIEAEIKEIEAIEPIFWKHSVLENIFEINKNKDKLYFMIFKVLKNKKSKKLYNKAIKMSELFEDEFIFIVFEKSTNFMTTNFSKLQTKLFLEKGISQYDYENETSLFISYLIMLNNFCKQK